MSLPNFGHQWTELELEGSTRKGHKKSPSLESRIKSLLSNLTPARRGLVFAVILFHVFLVSYLTLSFSHSLSPSVSRQASRKFQAKESRNVVRIPSKTYSQLPKKGSSSMSSKTYGSFPSKGVSNVSSAAHDHGSLAKKGVALANISSTTYGSLSNKGVQNVSSEAHDHGSLAKKGVALANITSTTYDRLSNKGVQNVSSEAVHDGLAKEGVLNISSTTHGSLPNKGCDSGRVYVYDLPTMFNYDILNNCTQIEPDAFLCDKNLNDGLGPVATEFAGMFPESIIPAFLWTDLYWGEVVFHNRMLNHKCRTLEPESATAFYIPYYAGLNLRKYLFGHSATERDWHPKMLIKWLQEQKWWNRSKGSDHFIMLGRMTWDFRRREESDDWGTSFLLMPGMQNVVRVSVERSEWDNLEIAVPYPSIFHPRSESDVTEWQKFVRSHRRNHLFTFVGGGRPTIKNDFRGILKSKCLNESAVCRHVGCENNNCMDGKTAVMAAFLDSDFCLQPKGDGMTRRSVFDCMVAGSIPVFFWRGTAYLQYEFSILPDEPESYSVFIDRKDVRDGTDIRKVLESYGREEVERMREKVIEYIPRFGYARPSTGLDETRDAFDIALDGVLTKYKDHMAKGRVENLSQI